MLVKIRAIDVRNPKGEVGKERLPVEVVETTIFIDPKTIGSICTYPIHSPEYMDAEEKRLDKAVFFEDILPHVQIYEHGLQRNAEG